MNVICGPWKCKVCGRPFGSLEQPASVECPIGGEPNYVCFACHSLATKSSLSPETELEGHILSRPEFIIGLTYGKPRDGHPEGAVINHILDVLKNVEKYSSPQNRAQLRLLAIVHDAFKYQVDRARPKTGDNHHGSYARKFLESIPNFPSNLLDLVELHDEAHNAWCKASTGKEKRAEERAVNLINRLGSRLPLYLTFFKCDNETGDKDQTCLHWFLDMARKHTKFLGQELSI